MTDELRPLLDAGFTLDELQAIGQAGVFGAMAAREEGSFRLDLESIEGVIWTHEKAEAYMAYVRNWLAKERGEGGA